MKEIKGASIRISINNNEIRALNEVFDAFASLSVITGNEHAEKHFNEVSPYINSLLKKISSARERKTKCMEKYFFKVRG